MGASDLVYAAIQRGELAKLDGSVACVDCGKPADVYDHRDYAKPLEVQAVCKRCNRRRGPAAPRVGHENAPKSFRLDAGTVDLIRSAADELKLSQRDVIRMAVRLWAKRMGIAKTEDA